MRRKLLIAGTVMLLALLAIPAAAFALHAADGGRHGDSGRDHHDGGIAVSKTGGWADLSVVTITERTAAALGIDAEEGVAVCCIHSGGPADDAGILIGDVVVSVGGASVDTVAGVRAALEDTEPGDVVTFTVDRSGTQSPHAVTLGGWDDAGAFHSRQFCWEGRNKKKGGGVTSGGSGYRSGAGIGVAVAQLTGALAERMGIDATEGVVVTRVVSGGPADDAGVEYADVIVSIDGAATATVASVKDAVAAADAGDTLSIIVDRGGVHTSVYVVAAEAGAVYDGQRHRLRFGDGAAVSLSLVRGTISAISGDTVTVTPEDGSAAVTATVTDATVVVKDGMKAAGGDLAVDDEGMAVIKDGELAVFYVGGGDWRSFRGHGFGRGGDYGWGGSDDRTARPFFGSRDGFDGALLFGQGLWRGDSAPAATASGSTT